MQRSGIIKKSLIEATAILLITAVMALTVNWLRPHPLALFKNPSEPAPEEPSPAPAVESESQAISIESAIEHFEQGTALFVDARLPVDYAAGHIKGAANLPVHRFDETIGPFLDSTAPETPIITYCDGTHCPLSKDLAEKLVLMGFEKVYHLPDGWAKWRAYRMPVQRGEAEFR